MSRIIVTVTPSDTSEKTVRWSTSDDTVAIVGAGYVRGIGAGICTITATTANGKTDACVITVTE
ncbi:MAG: hypothetical protein GX625_02105 [Clostridiaceae bacterium]|nr:hypothetical protein [Clostridiaceae bacterium]